MASVGKPGRKAPECGRRDKTHGCLPPTRNTTRVYKPSTAGAPWKREGRSLWNQRGEPEPGRRSHPGAGGPQSRRGAAGPDGASMRLVEGTDSRPGQRGCANGAPGGLAFELGASQAEDRAWGPMSLKTGAGGATGFALLMKADFISLRPLPAGEGDGLEPGRERQGQRGGGGGGGGEKEEGRWSACMCVCTCECVCVCMCLHVCVHMHACWLK